MSINNDKEPPRPLYLCEHCDFTDSNKGSTEAHIVQSHDLKQNYTCRLCRRSFESYDNLTVHTKRIHRRLPYVCGICNFKAKEYGNSRVMWYHMRARHVRITGESLKPLTCKVCQLKSTSNGMWDHMENHHMKSCYQCVLCKLYFNSQLKLRNHRATKHMMNVARSSPQNQVNNFRPIAPKTDATPPLSQISPAHPRIPVLTAPPKVPLGPPVELVCPPIETTRTKYTLHLKTRVCLVCGVAYDLKSNLHQHLQKLQEDIDCSLQPQYPNTSGEKHSMFIVRRETDNFKIVIKSDKKTEN